MGRPVMSVRVLLVAALAVLATLLTGPAAAGPERGQLVVEGRGGSSSELVLPRRVQLRHPLPELTGGGEYAAVLIEAVDPAPGRARTVGAVQVRAFRDSTSRLVAPLGIEGELEAGRYRVTLLGRGPVRAVYSLGDSSDPGIVLSPRTRIAQQFLGRAEQLTAGYSSASVDLPRSVAPGRRVVQVGLGDGVSADDYRMCVTAGEGCSRRLTPVCPPLLPCPTQEEDLPRPSVTSQPTIRAVLHGVEPVERALRWSVQGYRQGPGRLRAAAIVF